MCHLMGTVVHVLDPIWGLYTCIIYTAWYLNTSTTAVLIWYSSTTAALSRYSCKVKYTRRGTLVCDPVESGAVSRLMMTSYLQVTRSLRARRTAIMWNAGSLFINSTAVVWLYYQCSCTNRGVRLSLLQIPRAKLYEFYPAIRNTTIDVPTWLESSEYLNRTNSSIV